MTEPEAAPAKGSGVAVPRPRLSSRELFRGQREIVIMHGDHEYHLRITRADKLILTK